MVDRWYNVVISFFNVCVVSRLYTNSYMLGVVLLVLYPLLILFTIQKITFVLILYFGCMGLTTENISNRIIRMKIVKPWLFFHVIGCYRELYYCHQCIITINVLLFKKKYILLMYIFVGISCLTTMEHRKISYINTKMHKSSF